VYYTIISFYTLNLLSFSEISYPQVLGIMDNLYVDEIENNDKDPKISGTYIFLLILFYDLSFVAMFSLFSTSVELESDNVCPSVRKLWGSLQSPKVHLFLG